MRNVTAWPGERGENDTPSCEARGEREGPRALTYFLGGGFRGKCIEKRLKKAKADRAGLCFFKPFFDAFAVIWFESTLLDLGGLSW